MNVRETDRPVRAVRQSAPPLSVIKTDVNLSRLPFFALQRKAKQLEREWVFVETRGNEQVKLLWRVMATPRYGYPSPFAKKVYRALEYLLTPKGFPVPEYLDFSLYEIAEILGLKRICDVYSGKIYADIKDALLSIVTSSIESKGVFCYLDNGEKRWVHDVFHLYERFVFVGERLPDGTVAEKNRIYFGQWYLKSLNSLYIKPLDFPYWNSLRSDIAPRLYEYLSFISFATKCKPFSIEYYRLCEFLPITPQKYFSKAKQILSRAHQELIKTGFLKKVVWRKSKMDPKKWIITYYFGVRAKSEHKRGFKDLTYRPAILAVETADIAHISELAEGVEVSHRGAQDLSATGTVIESESEEQEVKQITGKRTPEEKELPSIAQELIERGITKSVAIDFAESFEEEYLVEKIEMHDYKKETGELTTNAAGWLREAIARDFKLSEEQRKKHQRLQKKQAGQKVRAEIEAQAIQMQEQWLKEALKSFPSDEEWVKERVMEHVNVREMTIKAVGGEPFSSEEIKEMYDKFKAETPKTDEEKREYLISNSNKYALSAIIEEIKSKSCDEELVAHGGGQS